METTDWKRAVKEAGAGSVSLELHVEPGASEPSFGPYDPWRQRIRLSVVARAEGGKANREVLGTIAGILGVPGASVVLVRGATTRRKTVRVDGMGLEEAISALARCLGDEGVSEAA